MSSAPETDEASTGGLLGLLLDEQQNLTAVERFAERHASGDLPREARVYRELVPTARPGAGQQFAFRVDLDACTGCKACVTACHSMNGLDPGETWREVGLLHGASDPYQQTVTTACHHCEDPGCLSGCPVQAYEKDAETGIVRHLDDQCIGCQYCVLKCPYDVPQYNASRGIVRKCDMCTDRLDVGEAPACVQGCPNEAISIQIVDTNTARPDTLLPVEAGAMPSSTITRPTTRYVSRRASTGPARPAAATLQPRADAHMPLVWMLIAVELSVGLLLVDVLSGLLAPRVASALRPAWVLLAAGAGVAGQAGAFAHLGRPLYAFRAFLGWRTSWMSREILVLGPFAGLLLAYAASVWLAAPLGELGAPVAALQPVLGIAALATGLAGTFCSVMIYADTRRPFWSLGRSGIRFFGSIVVLGPAAALLCVALAGPAVPGPLVWALAGACSAAVVAKLCAEMVGLRRRREPEASALGRSARLLAGPLRGALRLRVGAAALAIVGLAPVPVLLAGGGESLGCGLAAASLGLLLIGELLERRLFFLAEAAPAMPVASADPGAR